MKRKRLLFISFFLLIFLIGLYSQTWRLCTRVVDGDTIILDGHERGCLIWVDTPETKDPRKPVQYFGKEASEFTKRMVEGKKVRLEYDQNRIDKYGRTLAYVYLEEFRQYEREARENNRGLWAPREEEKS